MPTLIRLFIVLLVLAGLVFAGMVALTMTVDPGERDITLRIPPRELRPPSDAATPGGPIDLNDLPAPVNVAPRAESAAPVEDVPAISGSPPDENGVRTVEVPE